MTFAVRFKVERTDKFNFTFCRPFCPLLQKAWYAFPGFRFPLL